LFLAPQLKDLSERISPELDFQLFDFSVLNKLSLGAKVTSEAIEFICPRTALKQFVNAEITNQQLLDQSVILVNGVRIALNLQLVEYRRFLLEVPRGEGSSYRRNLKVKHHRLDHSRAGGITTDVYTHYQIGDDIHIAEARSSFE
jgi:hypothetical protein